ncbi:MAG: tRNA (adenosine(37)-N6)-threonylcarbamoyltransferase complex ATPase subunit type 1 TsaE [Candidatus Velthaea sp.]|jgi:tRNA threonylcarbamoyladenosine biosynthesis protein TsaE
MAVTLPDERSLDVFAIALAASLAPGDVLGLRGPLGAGKTTLVRALVRALHGSDSAVSSPTFVFRQRYDGTPPVEHLDLYRLEDPAELPHLGLEDAFAPDRITLVEWPEHAPGLLPPHARTLTIAGSGMGPRTIET